MPRTYDPNGLKINPRRAEEIVTAQNTEHQQAVTQNQQAGQIVERQAAPQLSAVNQAAQQNANLTGVNPQGVIEQNAIERLRAAGLNDAQIQQRMNDPSYKQGIQQAFNQVGTNSAQESKLMIGGVPADPLVSAQHEAATATTKTQQMEQQQIQADSEKKKATESATSSAASSAAAANTDPMDAGMNAAFQNLPPEAQALAPFFQNILGAITEGQKEQAATTQALLSGGIVDVNGEPVEVQGMQSTFDTIDKKLKDMESGYTTMQQGIQGMLDRAKEQQDKYLSQQEQAAKDRLTWQEQQMLRQAAKDKQSAVDMRIAKLALTGGFGSDAGLREVEETRMEYEKHMGDIQTEFGIQRTELAAKFTGLYLEASNEHYTKSISNIKETAAALERIAGQSLASTQARATAEQNILGKFLDQQTTGRKEYAGTLKDFAGQMMSQVIEGRKAKQAEAKWEYEMKWRMDTDERDYGLRVSEFGERMDQRELELGVRLDDKERALIESKTNALRGKINEDKIIGPFRKDIQPIYENMKEAYKAGDNAFSDRALAKIYEKMVEPNSVVMPGEYTDIAGSAPLFNKIAGKYKKVMEGGQAWTGQERKELFDLASSFYKKYEERYIDASRGFYQEIEATNMRLRNPEFGIDPSIFGLPTFSTSSQRKTLDDLGEGLPEDARPRANPFGGGEDTVGNDLLSFGRVTQGYATPVSSRATGGLYSEATVQAWGGRHRGLDIAMPEGTKLPSLVSGTVVAAGYESGWGKTVLIKDGNGALHRLSHLKAIAPLREGDRIRRGDVIALSGNTGNSTGPHLDYRIKKDGSYIDPLKYKLPS